MYCRFLLDGYAIEIKRITIFSKQSVLGERGRLKMALLAMTLYDVGFETLNIYPRFGSLVRVSGLQHKKCSQASPLLYST
jgi:hypothetical protein